MPIIYASCIAKWGNWYRPFVYLWRMGRGRGAHNLVIRKELLLIYIFECKLKKKIKKSSVIDALQSMIFIIQMRKILNCFPNSYINPGESFFYLNQTCVQRLFLFAYLFCQTNADWKCLMNLAFHKHYEFSQIAQSILSKLIVIFF